MGLSPLSVALEIDYEEVACILAGYTLNEVEGLLKHGPEFKYQVADVFAWKQQIIEAVGREDLKAKRIQIYRFPMPDEREHPGIKSWRCDDATTLMLSIFEPDEIRMQLQKPEIARWLKASGIADDDVPKALRVLPKPKKTPESHSKPLHNRRRQTYLTLIEALALEVLGEIPDKPYKTADRLTVILESHGLTLNKEPIAETVREIQEAREERSP